MCECIDRLCNLLSPCSHGAWVRSWHGGVKGDSYVSLWPLAGRRVVGVQRDVGVRLGNWGRMGNCRIAAWGSLVPVPFIILDPIYSKLCPPAGRTFVNLSVLFYTLSSVCSTNINSCRYLYELCKGIALALKVIIKTQRNSSQSSLLSWSTWSEMPKTSMSTSLNTHYTIWCSKHGFLSTSSCVALCAEHFWASEGSAVSAWNWHFWNFYLGWMSCIPWGLCQR